MIAAFSQPGGRLRVAEHDAEERLYPPLLIAASLERCDPGYRPASEPESIIPPRRPFWWLYARTGRRLIDPNVKEAELRAIDRGFAPGVPLYLVVFGLAFLSPLAAVILTLLLAAFYLPSATLFTER
jgi:hypothetical protein